jgi:hypothetical protein
MKIQIFQVSNFLPQRYLDTVNWCNFHHFSSAGSSADFFVHFVNSLLVDGRALQDLDLFGDAVLERIDDVWIFEAIGRDGVGQKLEDDCLAIAGAETEDLVSEALSDSLGLSTLGVARLWCLSRHLLGDGGHEKSEGVAVGGGDLFVAVDQSLPFFDDWELFVSGLLHSVKHELAVFQVDVFADELEFFVTDLIVLDIALVKFVTSTHQVGTGEFVTDGFVGTSFTNVSDGEASGGSEVVPFFSGKWINGLLLSSSFTSLWYSLIFSNGHGALNNFEAL